MIYWIAKVNSAGPASTVNTGDLRGPFTRIDLERI